MTLREIKTIDMDPNDCDEKTFIYNQGLQKGAEIAEREMINCAQRYVGIMIDKLNENCPEIKLDTHGILINLEYDMKECNEKRESRASVFDFGSDVTKKSGEGSYVGEPGVDEKFR